MISFREYLIEAQDYEAMFNPFFKVYTGDYADDLKENIKNEIKWARLALKKNDRIVWYLSWFRLSLYWVYVTDTSKFSSEISRAVDINNSDDVKIFDEDDVKRNATSFLNGSTLSKIREELKHYFSMKVPKIDEYTFKPLVFWDIIKRKFNSFEGEYFAAGDEDIPYLEQPLPDHAEDEDEEVAFPIIRFSGDYYWVNLGKPYCRKEGNAMGHCGNTASYKSDDNILSFRKLEKKTADKRTWYWHPSMTFILNGDNFLGEMKGRSNRKPDDKYHKYIIDLLLSKVQMSSSGKEGYYIAGVRGGGYAPEENFSLNDLTEADKNNLYSIRPELMPISEYYKKNGRTEELLARIEKYMGTGFSWYNEDKKYIIYDKVKGGIQEFLEDWGNSTAKWIAGILEEGYIEHYEISSYERDSVKELFNISKVENYLRENFPDDEENWEDAPLEYAIEEIEGLEDAINSACYSGGEEGTFDAVHEFVQSNMDDMFELLDENDYETDVYVEVQKADLWSQPLIVSISLENFIKGIDISLFDNTSNLKQLDWTEPHYGFSGWSDEGAKNRLIDEGFEELL